MTVDFEETRASTYLPRPVRKRARIIPAAPDEPTTIVAEWGADEHFVGPWVAVLDEGGATRYGVSYDEFIATHERLPEADDLWRKTAAVDAYRHVGPSGTVVTVVGAALVETVNTIDEGDWLVRQAGGAVQVVTDGEFRSLYDVEHPVVAP